VTGRAACASQVRAWQARMENALAERLPPAAAEPTRLHHAMRYCVLNTGQRLRPVLVFGTARALGLAEAQVEGVACAIELVHAYALVHDALSGVEEDADAGRRGPCHAAYDAGTAVLVGDALQSLAFQLLASDAALPAAPQVRLRLIALLARAIGVSGLTGGQSLDAAARGEALSVREIEAWYSRRCGALIEASVLMAAACASRSAAAPAAAPHESLADFASKLALALRLRRELAGSDDGGAARRAHYVAALGDGAREQLGRLQAQALGALEPLGPAAHSLRELAQCLLEMRPGD